MAGSASGDLVGLEGTGKMVAAYTDDTYPYELSWRREAQP